MVNEAPNTRAAPMEERMREVQVSQEEFRKVSNQLRETTTRQGEMLERILRRLDEMRPHNRDREGSNGLTNAFVVGGGNPGDVGTAHTYGHTGGIQTRTMKLNFPKFDGKNPSEWLFKAKQYFSYHQVSHEQWLTITSFNVEGDSCIMLDINENQLWLQGA
ncbi:hypothetical protein AMTR_s00042p00119240 [Amborella trichopoda]|uniref:Retrotransposon gag domain-containing protein n=1 Tax=Amborella trichopoda TaxID=13333 RepID=W1P6M5_AMBTC|nr:hypothetical protein AMTR_s00042p00119240 [Amborella trichopoda]